MSFHRTQYLELSSKVTRQLCLELLTWGMNREGQCKKVAREKPLGHGLPLPFLSPQDRGITPAPCAPESRARLEGEGGQQFQRQLAPEPGATVRVWGTASWWECRWQHRLGGPLRSLPT